VSTLQGAKDAVAACKYPPEGVRGVASVRAARYGQDAVKFVNSEEGKRLHMRGINTRILQSGTIRVGDKVKKL